MDVLTPVKDQIPWLLVLALPGFIAIRVFELLVPSRITSTGRETLEALSFGAVNFGVWAVPVIHWLPWLKVRPIRATLVAIGVLVVSPALLGIGTFALRNWSFLQRWIPHPVPTAWDLFFGRAQPAWMRIRLKSGHVVGGYFGENSFASSDADNRDLYIERAWRLNPADFAFIAPADRSMGILISSNECSHIELFFPEGATQWQQTKTEG